MADLITESSMGALIKIILFVVLGLLLGIPLLALLGLVGVPLLGMVVGLVGAGVGLLFALLKIGLMIVLPVLVLVWLGKMLFAGR